MSYVDGNAVVHCACRDVTDHRRARDELVYVNPRLAGMFGYAKESEVMGRRVEDLIAQSWRNQVVENMTRRLAGECYRTRLEFVALGRDGTEFEVSVDGTVSSDQGRPALVGLIEDLSDRQKSANELKAYVSKLELAVLGTVQVASSMVELRDPYTTGHERRVGEIAAAIGHKMRLDSHHIDGLRIIGQVHDIGKIGIPAEILSKPGRLSRSEMDLIREHSQKGHDILKTIEYPWPIADAVLQHHERMDGSGYPQGLAGDQIVLEARIMAVADTIEAMSAHRPYRAGLGLDSALNEIERGNGIQYDAETADACLTLFREDRYALPA